jgi:hypothetical protein
MEREYYTKHGMHLNVRGKERMPNKAIAKIQEITVIQNKNDIISLP